MGKNAFWMVVIIFAAIAGALLGPRILDDVPIEITGILALAFLLGVVALVVYSLSGNRGGAVADEAEAAAARAMTPLPGKARLYFVRKGFVAGMQAMDVAVEGVASGQVKSNQFLALDLDPGRYTLVARMARGAKSTRSSLDLALSGGEVAVVHAYVEMNTFAAKTVLSRLGEAEARDKLSGARMRLWAERAPVAP